MQQVTILLQGTRHSEREDIISQLEIILSRLKNGENTGFEHDDDFGYSFQYDAAAVGKSSFSMKRQEENKNNALSIAQTN